MDFSVRGWCSPRRHCCKGAHLHTENPNFDKGLMAFLIMLQNLTITEVLMPGPGLSRNAGQIQVEGRGQKDEKAGQALHVSMKQWLTVQ